MASSDRLLTPYQTAFDAAGDAAPGAKLNFYVTATTTRKDTYSDAALSVPNANPIIANSAGRFGTIYLGSGDYKIVLTDENDVELWSADPVAKSGTNSASTTVAGIIEIATEAEALLGTSTSLAIVPDTAVAMIQQGFTYGGTVGGTANAITVTPSILPAALAAGMKFTFKATATNTSATTINFAALGVVSARVNGPSGSTAMAGGEIVSGNTYEATYSAADSCWFISGVGEALGSIQSLTEETAPDWAADWFPMFDISAKLLKKMKLNSLVAAQSDFETPTSLVLIATPGRLQYHPGVAKLRVKYDQSSGTATVGGTSYNLSSLTDGATGLATANLTTAMSDSNCHVTGSTQRPSTNNDAVFSLQTGNSPTTTTIPVATTINAVNSDMSYTSVVAHGDQ